MEFDGSPSPVGGDPTTSTTYLENSWLLALYHAVVTQSRLTEATQDNRRRTFSPPRRQKTLHELNSQIYQDFLFCS